MSFSPIELQIDNVLYEVPFDRWFVVLSDDMIALGNITSWSNVDKLTLGMKFLNTYYQAYDMKRN